VFRRVSGFKSRIERIPYGCLLVRTAVPEPPKPTRGQTPEDVERLKPPAPAFATGDPVPGLNSWILERELGVGGFGAVWLAVHALNRKEKPRAVKFCTHPDARHRLVTHEKNVVARVMKYAGDHPNIVPLLEYNLDGEIPWLMYEFVEGGTLASRVSEWRALSFHKRMSLAIRTLHALAGALATCHRLDPPLVHRDMKPQNVLMAGGRVPRITDFGIGSVVLQPRTDGPTGALTAYAARVTGDLRGTGTRRYAPPEQLLGSVPHPRVDVYALGMIAYQLVTADLSAEAGTDAALDLHNLKVPKELASLIVRSVAINPDRRPKDAVEWETTLAGLIPQERPLPGSVESSGSASVPVLLPEPPTKSSTRRTRPQPPSRPTGLPPEDVEEPPRRVRRFGLVPGVLLVVALVLVAVAVALVGRSGKRTDPTGAGDIAQATPQPPRKDAPDPEPPKGGSKLTVPKVGDTCEIEIAPNVRMVFCWIPAGECQLGSPKAEQDYIRKPGLFVPGKPFDPLENETELHRGKFRTDGFWLGKYEVTQAEWTAVMNGTDRATPSWFRLGVPGEKELGRSITDTSRFPVENVSWDMIRDENGFLTRANAHGGIRKAFGRYGKLALPHEDEWEYAYRGGRGNGQPFYWGNWLNGTEANCNDGAPYGTDVIGPYLRRTCSVDDTNEGKYPRHPWGLMHMSGNVSEWCENKFDKANERAVRGGGWNVAPRFCRAASRSGREPGYYRVNLGFRVCFHRD
jgi:formylglycine-generating enzyme required for sulfatase activity/serine/threonine protein kinase